MLPDEDALIRQADALWLAGYIENARNIWVMLAAARSETAIKPSAMYNLAVTSPTQEEAKTQYELLVKNTNAADLFHQYGVIQYSRLMELSKALTFLNAERLLIHDAKSSNAAAVPAALPSAKSALTTDALFDLEIIKRHMETTEPARVIAETWLLLDHYPEAEELYQWGAWYFCLQRNDNETALLLRAASRHNFTGDWKDIHNSLLLIHEGNLDAAEEILSSIRLNNETWIVAANLGRIYEARQAPSRAIANYEKAFKIITSSHAADWAEAASKIQVRIANCNKTMGKTGERRRALEYALELNPDNLNARLELNR